MASFSGLSSPVLMWYETLNRTGTVTVPIEAFILSNCLNVDGTGCFEVDTQGSRETVTVLATLGEGEYSCTVNRVPHSFKKIGLVAAVEIPGNGKSLIEFSRG